MTAPLDILIAYVLSGAVALTCRTQLRLSPRPWYATRDFAALCSLFGLVVIPASAYRYFLHPDWAAMYLFDVNQLSGLFGLLGLVLVFGSAVGAFALGNYCARAHREWILLASMAAAIGGIVTLSLLGLERIRLVGSHNQWVGTFGLRPLGETDLYWSALVMGALVIGAWLHVLWLLSREGSAIRNASR